jgi:uncharacterized protein (TIGR03000 family)
MSVLAFLAGRADGGPGRLNRQAAHCQAAALRGDDIMVQRIISAAGLVLVAVAALAWSANPAPAQRHGGGHGGGYHGSSGGYHGGYGGYHGGYYGGYPGYYHDGYHSGWNGGWGWGALGFGLGYALGSYQPFSGSGYYPSYSYGYAPSYGYYPTYDYGNYQPLPGNYLPSYDSVAPGTVLTTPNYSYVPGTMQPTPSYSYGSMGTTVSPDGSAPVQVQVQVPAEAKVWFNGSETTLTGPSRLFESPPVAPGGSYTYTIKASWMENGKEMTQTRQLDVRPGQRTRVDFTQPAPRTEEPKGK